MRSFLMISAGATALHVAAFPALAETPSELDRATVLTPVTVVGTRTQRRADDVPASVSIITADQIEDTLATDIKDLIRFEPGVSVPTSPTRFSAALSGAGRDETPASPSAAWAAIAS